MGAVIPYAELSDIARFARNRKLGIALTIGCFDLLHEGHRYHLENCRFSIGEECLLVVGIKSDKTVRQIKGEGRPFMDETARAMSVAALPAVDFVAIIPANVAGGRYGLEMVQMLQPDIYFVPPNCQGLAARLRTCHNAGTNLVLTPRTPPPGFEGISTTRILEELKRHNN